MVGMRLHHELSPRSLIPSYNNGLQDIFLQAALSRGANLEQKCRRWACRECGWIRSLRRECPKEEELSQESARTGSDDTGNAEDDDFQLFSRSMEHCVKMDRTNTRQAGTQQRRWVDGPRKSRDDVLVVRTE